MRIKVKFGVLLIILFSNSVWSQNTDSIINYSIVNEDELDYPIIVFDDNWEQAEFPGGQTSLTDYLVSEYNYPESAIKDSIEGRILLVFNISDQGKIHSVEVVKGLREDVDSEAIRVLMSMPDWIPATQNGKNIECKLGIPFNLSLDKKTNDVGD